MTRRIKLTRSDRVALERIRDTHPLPHYRERAAAILKVASGMSARSVARTGLLRERSTDTIYAWLDRWEKEGLDGFNIRKGRGRRSKYNFTEEDKEKLLELLHQSPESCGIEKSRWTIRDIQKSYQALKVYSDSGVWRILKRLGISYKRGKTTFTVRIQNIKRK